MTTPQALLVGFVLLTVSIVFVSSTQTATAFAGGPYALTPHSNTSANVGVFKLDVNTGDVSYCYLSGGAQTELVCTKPVR